VVFPLGKGKRKGKEVKKFSKRKRGGGKRGLLSLKERGRPLVYEQGKGKKKEEEE